MLPPAATVGFPRVGATMRRAALPALTVATAFAVLLTLSCDNQSEP